jgi:hypothetical protein
MGGGVRGSIFPSSFSNEITGTTCGGGGNGMKDRKKGEEMIALSSGLKNSLVVLELLRNNEELKDIPVSVGTFTNSRECGLTFAIIGKQCFTWCVYEHRNGDSIIINGKSGYISMNGELPYIADSNWEYIASFEFGEYSQAAEKLSELVQDFWKKEKKMKFTVAFSYTEYGRKIIEADTPEQAKKFIYDTLEMDGISGLGKYKCTDRDYYVDDADVVEDTHS